MYNNHSNQGQHNRIRIKHKNHIRCWIPFDRTAYAAVTVYAYSWIFFGFVFSLIDENCFGKVIPNSHKFIAHSPRRKSSSIFDLIFLCQIESNVVTSNEHICKSVNQIHQNGFRYNMKRHTFSNIFIRNGEKLRSKTKNGNDINRWKKNISQQCAKPNKFTHSTKR